MANNLPKTGVGTKEGQTDTNVVQDLLNLSENEIEQDLTQLLNLPKTQDIPNDKIISIGVRTINLYMDKYGSVNYP